MSHSLRTLIDTQTYADQSSVLQSLIDTANLTDADRTDICAAAAQLVRDIRSSTSRE